MKIKHHCFLLLTLLFLFPSFSASAQYSTVHGKELAGYQHAELDAQFTSYRVFDIASADMVSIVRDEDFANRLAIDLPETGLFKIDLYENRIVAENYVLTVATENGITRTPWDGIVKTFKGNLTGGQYNVSLTIDYGFIYGFIELPGSDRLRIEPLNMHIKGANDDLFITYKVSDVIDQGPRGCLTLNHSAQISREGEEQTGEPRVLNECLEVEIAYADDWLMVDDHGSVQNVENHNIGVMNDSQTNFDNEFSDEYVFIIVEIWVSNCSSCDPWSGTLNSGALLDEFRSWGPGGFSETYDVADLWTDRDFNGTTIGVSWVDAVCSSFRYLTTQDFTGNGNLLRCLLSHELGHNFGSNHDPEGAPTIMAPSVQNTNDWSNSSVNQINNYMGGVNCLSTCQTVQAPVADFSADEVEGCPPFVVQFFDESTGPPTSWDWTFPGGSPGSSTQQNPSVTYNTPGTYDVILEVSNSAGSNTITRVDYITVLANPIADFIYDQTDLSVQFTSLSENAESWLWDFGDGNTSTMENPFHTYDEDGEYVISLIVSNDCGSDEFIVIAEIFVAPEADFSYSTDFGCAPLVVQFINESSDNVQSLEWFFPGGSPSFSIEENPVVTYAEPGFYDVTLIVENIAGVDELSINNLIEVAPFPESDFNFAINGLSVQFVNSSVDADDFLWVFGDGNTSTAFSPNHVYSSGGIYQVMLIASNICGSDTSFASVNINSAPIADFTVSGDNGCIPFTVTYVSTSQGDITSYQWSFPGGVPATSTNPMPVVTYNAAGMYSAQLIVGNAVGFDTLMIPDVVTVNPNVVSGFLMDIQGDVVDFTNTSTGASSYTWTVDGDVFTSTDLTYVFAEDGDYIAQLIACGVCGCDTTATMIHIATPPMAGIASDITSGCEPLTVQFFNNSSSNATTFAWTFEGGIPSTSDEENPVVVFPEPGLFSVSLMVWSEVGSDMLVIDEMIEVFPLPVSQFETSQAGLEITFMNSSQYAEEFLWYFGDGITSIESDPVHTYADYGTYEVTLISGNNCGFDTTVLNLELSTAPVPAFSVGDRTGCVPYEVQFMDQSQNSPEVWEWTFPGGSPGTSNLQNPVVVYDQPGMYSVTLRVSNAGGTQVLIRNEYILVAYPPVPEFAFDMSGSIVAFENQSENGDKYFWMFGDGSVDTAANPIHVYQANGTYPVTLIVSNYCASDTLVYDVTVTVTGVEDFGEGSVMVYPNPNRGTFTVELVEVNVPVNICVFDVLGRQVYRSDRAFSGSAKREIVLPDVLPGMYTTVISGDNMLRVIKVVVAD